MKLLERTRCKNRFKEDFLKQKENLKKKKKKEKIKV